MVSCVIALVNRDSTSHKIYFLFVNSSSCCSDYLANTCEFVIICSILLDTFHASGFNISGFPTLSAQWFNEFLQLFKVAQVSLILATLKIIFVLFQIVV